MSRVAFFDQYQPDDEPRARAVESAEGVTDLWVAEQQGANQLRGLLVRANAHFDRLVARVELLQQLAKKRLKPRRGVRADLAAVVVDSHPKVLLGALELKGEVEVCTASPERQWATDQAAHRQGPRGNLLVRHQNSIERHVAQSWQRSNLVQGNMSMVRGSQQFFLSMFRQRADVATRRDANSQRRQSVEVAYHSQ